MIEALVSPKVVVVDDEPEDYRPILTALNSVHVATLHYKGDDLEALPPEPFRSVRLVFMDLHLGPDMYKGAASRAANVFQTIVSDEAPAVVVVIWSKYADEKEQSSDEETQAEAFIRTLLEARPRFRDRLIFLQMPKPRQADRSANWIDQLTAEVKKTVADRPSIEFLWGWERLVENAGSRVSEGLALLAERLDKNGVSASAVPNLELNIRGILQGLARAQGEGDWSTASAHSHLVGVLNELLTDQIQHSDGVAALASHGRWIAAQPPASVVVEATIAAINGFLLSATTQSATKPFLPGTVYECLDPDKLRDSLGMAKLTSLFYECCSPKIADDLEASVLKLKRDEITSAWNQAVKPVLVEISADCDVAQNKRPMATLLVGLAVPADQLIHAKRGGAFETLPLLDLRWPDNAGVHHTTALLFCSRYKLTLPSANVPTWLRPWFRLRDMPTAAIRNWHSSNSARVGYVSLRAK